MTGTTSPLMQMAVLALDAYHRSYRQGIEEVETRTDLGFATVDKAEYVDLARQDIIRDTRHFWSGQE